MSFVRIVHSKQVVNKELEDGNESRLAYSLLHITRSKISTNLIMEGKSDYEVLDMEPDINDTLFATSIVACTDLIIYFDSASEVGPYSDPKKFIMQVGDVLSYSGIQCKKIEVPNPLKNRDSYQIFNFAMKLKNIKGNGSKQYKVAITFSDTYEIDIFADSEDDAKKYALDIDFSEWDHIYDNIDISKMKEYRTQKIRYTVWHPNQFYIK